MWALVNETVVLPPGLGGLGPHCRRRRAFPKICCQQNLFIPGSVRPSRLKKNLDLAKTDIFAFVDYSAIHPIDADPFSHGQMLELKRRGLDGIVFEVGPEGMGSTLGRLVRGAHDAGLKVQIDLRDGTTPVLESISEGCMIDKHGFINGKDPIKNPSHLLSLTFGLDDKNIPKDGRTGIQYRAGKVDVLVRDILSLGGGLWGKTVTDICLPMGPDGVWVYPSSPAFFHQHAHWHLFFKQVGAPNFYERGSNWLYPSHKCWWCQPDWSERKENFPGAGQYMCFDRWLLQDLKDHAEAAGCPEWGAPPIRGRVLG
eukprot:jgi/Botrbrau1/10060/Bobra.0355s0016.1